MWTFPEWVFFCAVLSTCIWLCCCAAWWSADAEIWENSSRKLFSHSKRRSFCLFTLLPHPPERCQWEINFFFSYFSLLLFFLLYPCLLFMIFSSLDDSVGIRQILKQVGRERLSSLIGKLWPSALLVRHKTIIKSTETCSLFSVLSIPIHITLCSLSPEFRIGFKILKDFFYFHRCCSHIEKTILCTKFFSRRREKCSRGSPSS